MTEEQKGKRRLHSKRYRERNVDKISAAKKQYYLDNRDKLLARVKQHVADNQDYYKSREYYFSKLNKKRGITDKFMRQVFNLQNGKCAICTYTFTSILGRDVKRDHCHKTRRFRGLLCQGCNVLLGALERRGFNIEGFAQYTQHPPALELAEGAAAQATSTDPCRSGVCDL